MLVFGDEGWEEEDGDEDEDAERPVRRGLVRELRAALEAARSWLGFGGGMAETGVHHST